MKKDNVIAIDGPAGSGKSTVAREVARRLGRLYVDTGAMYRALTLKAMTESADLSDEKALVSLSEAAQIYLESREGDLKVFLDKKDVSESIRSMDVTSNVKHLASLKGVRKNMVRLQRSLAEGALEGSVLEGRDIGTAVFPDARLKFYLDASVNVRASRRFKELKEKKKNVSLEEVSSDVRSRDATDISRKEGPLKKAKDAIFIDTTDMTVEEVVKTILSRVNNE